jgi:tRNA threonylcarbamoyladenosine biosynthesis protein TsaB
MVTLALDTSGPVGSIAIREAGEFLRERTLQVGVHHGQGLVPEVNRLFCDTGKCIRDCDLIAVSIGPGSFTGLRVGVVFAKTLAYALGCRVAAINTLLAIAHNSPPDVERVQAVSDAQRGELFVEEFERRSQDEWESVGPVRIVRAADWASRIENDVAVIGPGLETMATALSNRCRMLPRELWSPRAACLAKLGERTAAESRLADPWALEPAYLRKSSAEEKWEARQRTVTDGRDSRVPQAADKL